MKKFAPTIALAIALSVLCGWFFLYEQKVRPDKTKAEEKAKQLTTLEQDKISELAITRTLGETVETTKLRKVDKEWMILSPVQAKADDSAVSSLLSTLTSTKQDRVVDEKPASLATYGLDKPSVQISVKENDSAPAQEILLGLDTPTGNGLYVKLLPGETVYKAPNSIRSSLEKNTFTLREKALFSISRFDISEAEIRSSKGEIILKKGDKNKWNIANHDFPAETTEWDSTLGAVLDLKATSFPAENPKDFSVYGLASPLAKVTLTHSKDGKSSRPELWIGQAKGKTYARLASSPIVYEIENSVIAKVARPWTAFQTKSLLPFDRFAVKRIRLERGKEIVELLKENADWTFPTEPGIKVANAKVDTLLAALQDAKVTSYGAQKSPAPATAPLVIKLFETKDSKESEIATVLLQKPSGKTVSGHRSGLGYGFQISGEDFKKLDLNRGDFVDAAAEPKKG